MLLTTVTSGYRKIYFLLQAGYSIPLLSLKFNIQISFRTLRWGNYNSAYGDSGIFFLNLKEPFPALLNLQ